MKMAKINIIFMIKFHFTCYIAFHAIESKIKYTKSRVKLFLQGSATFKIKLKHP